MSPRDGFAPCHRADADLEAMPAKSICVSDLLELANMLDQRHLGRAQTCGLVRAFGVCPAVSTGPSVLG